jgi:hypothetical protein
MHDSTICCPTLWWDVAHTSGLDSREEDDLVPPAGLWDLPADFNQRYDSGWVTPPNRELGDPEQVRKYLYWNLDELEHAGDLAFDGVGTNEHHSNVYGFPVAPTLTAATLARRRSDAAICILGTTPPPTTPMRVAEEIARPDRVSAGRIITGVPVGSACSSRRSTIRWPVRRSHRTSWPVSGSSCVRRARRPGRSRPARSPPGGSPM